MTDYLDNAIATALNALTDAMWLSSTTPDQIADAIVAWRDCSIEEGRDKTATEVMSTVVADAIWQANEHRTRLHSIRIISPRGERVLFTWDAEGGDPGAEFERAVTRAVQSALLDA